MYQIFDDITKRTATAPLDGLRDALTRMCCDWPNTNTEPEWHTVIGNLVEKIRFGLPVDDECAYLGVVVRAI
ncbi:hypothetical protein [Bifidobacterium pullorum]|uniref:hypothetical protein n=1 Tax=Bifidobacterium pullorum TaxID=78448 RepID=UPI0024AD235C|nr:hypothetical protein [Bifidobacterium pullorum]